MKKINVRIAQYKAFLKKPVSSAEKESQEEVVAVNGDLSQRRC